jgi:Mn-dependent DtxR family transcriptional regulator
VSSKSPDERFVSIAPDLVAAVDGFAARITSQTGEACSRARATRLLLSAALSATDGVDFDRVRAAKKLEADMATDTVRRLREFAEQLEASIGAAP